MPRLSIITVNLNNRDGLIKTAESLRIQTYGNYEWIVIDGGSADGGADVIKKYAAGNHQLTYWCSECDDGIYHAMNKGISKALGDYCLFLNSGDYLPETTSLEKFLSVDFDEDIVYGDMISEACDGERRIRRFKDRVRPSDLLYGILPHQNMLIKTALLKAKKGYRTDLKIVADWVFYTEAICREKASYRHVPAALAVNQNGGVSTDPKFWNVHKSERMRMSKELFTCLRRFIYFFSMASVKSKIEKIRYRYDRARKR